MGALPDSNTTSQYGKCAIWQGDKEASDILTEMNTINHTILSIEGATYMAAWALLATGPCFES